MAVMSPHEMAFLAAEHARLQTELTRRGLDTEAYPASLPAGLPNGTAAARAWPIQGILKYHGLANWGLRTAYLPSISVNNDAACTLTVVQFDTTLLTDEVIINGTIPDEHAVERVRRTLDRVRALAGIQTRARVTSANRTRASRVGKGLGTSASASAALAMAAIAATLGPDLAMNRRFLSCLARLLAGSGCRSATGGLSLWLSHPGISHEDSYSLRIDRQHQLRDLALITIPIDSRVGIVTEAAHREAPQSPFFVPWCKSRVDEALACIDAALAGDWQTLGRWAELDSIRLHAVTMTGSLENKLFAWEPENITLFRMCNDLRAAGIPVYASTDTGPTVVLLTARAHARAVVAAVQALDLGLETVEGAVAGPAELVSPEAALAELESHTG
ncbi:MAG: diphosphomevalonate/mevalonate 3,5-bisphosphate decarboxylase family protein [Anaerolineae bacterium]|jgi:phosphomevalonate decarboxylase|nr:GHMP kinase [Chloroflexota bacterium]